MYSRAACINKTRWSNGHSDVNIVRCNLSRARHAFQTWDMMHRLWPFFKGLFMPRDSRRKCRSTPCYIFALPHRYVNHLSYSARSLSIREEFCDSCCTNYRYLRPASLACPARCEEEREKEQERGRRERERECKGRNKNVSLRSDLQTNVSFARASMHSRDDGRFVIVFWLVIIM